MIEPLVFPKAPLKLSKKGENLYVWCIARRKKLLLTPEEWVRQHVLHYLISSKEFPLGLIASEYAIQVNGLSRRCDLVAFDENGNPIMIVECKATQIEINEKTLHQIAQYNFKLNVELLLLTNGLQWVLCQIDKETKTIKYHQEIPMYHEISH
jgi:predicted type IV restriction endonuclease